MFQIRWRLPANKFGCGDVFRGKKRGTKQFTNLNIRRTVTVYAEVMTDRCDALFFKRYQMFDRKLYAVCITEKYGFVRNMHHAYVFSCG